MSPTRHPLRLLHIVHDTQYGGLQRLVLDLTRRTAVSHVETHVLSMGPVGALARDLGDSGLRGIVQIHSPPTMTRASMLFPWALSKFIRGLRPHVVHMHSGVWFKSARAARLAGTPRIIYTEHGREYPDPFVARLLGRIAHRSTHKVVAVSNALARYLSEVIGVPAAKLLVVPNGVDTSVFRPRSRPQDLAKSMGIGPRSLVVGSVGRLEPVKRFDILIRAFAQVVRALGRDVHLVLVGEGSERHRLEGLSSELGISHQVRLVGWQQNTPAFYTLFDAFALSSDSEGMPISLLEAMACGIAPVACSVGGVGEILTGELRIQLVPARDVNALAQKLLQLLTDESYRVRVGEHGMRHVTQSHSLDKTVQAYHALYGISAGEVKAELC